MTLPPISRLTEYPDLLRALIDAFRALEEADSENRKTKSNIDLTGVRMIGVSPDGTRWALKFNDDGIPTQEPE